MAALAIIVKSAVAADTEALHADALRSGLDWLVDGKTNIANGGWVHVVAVFNTSGRWQLYANAKLVGERKPTAIVTWTLDS